MKNYVATLLSIIFCCSSILAQSKVVVKDGPKNLNEGLADLTNQISKDLTENQKRKIAVVEFVDLKGEVTDLGRYLSEKLITKLFQTKKITVVERQLLNKIITEQKLSLTGIIDPGSAQKLGKLLGVDAIAAGSISDLTKTIEINARLISTETGEVFSAASTEILKDETVCNLMDGCKNSNNSAIQQDEANPRPTPKPTPAKPKSWIVDSGLFTFELHRCRVSGNIVACDFTITNNDVDKRLNWAAGFNTTKLYDEFNNEILGRRSELANVVGRAEAGYSPRAFLISGVPTRARIFFEGINTNTTKAVLIQIGVGVDNSSSFNIQFRNIPLEK